MREIKFRVWDRITQLYSGGDLWGIKASGTLYYGNAEWPNGIVEQFTGLHDKNGKEIYEGDIIESGYNANVTGPVVYEQGRFAILGPKDHEWIMYTNILPDMATIIGNIHETEGKDGER